MMQFNTKRYWLELKKKINARSHRERTLLLVTGIALIWVFMFSYIITPIGSQIDEAAEEKSNLEQQYHGTSQELKRLQNRLSGKVNSQTKDEYHQLESLLIEHNKTLSKFKEKLIAPEKVPFLLENILNDFLGLSLQRIETLPPQILGEHKSEEVVGLLYRQPIKIILIGEYGDLLHYLKKIESLPYPIWWLTLDYKITQFPKAQISLTVYTISEHFNWIGV
ncbi:MAG: type II secretion system protein M [Gammaproteobacteria bacterium]|nr:type II secretion system protein M [Gammaproteobacteria bacterium]